MPMPPAIVWHPWCELHDTGEAHPERADRLRAIHGAIARDAELDTALRHVEARPAALQDLLRVHPPEHVERMRRLAEEAERSERIAWVDEDTAVSALSFDAALAAAGCAITAADLVARGVASSALALARPPGHHATPDRAMGFCLFNNVAVAARRLQAQFGVERVLVVDWDVHHGNGTQEIFWTDGSVHFLSLHLAPPHYPGTGLASERGEGDGEGATWNVPLAPGTPAPTYRRLFTEALDAAAEAASPEIVLVSSGFDALAGDPLGGLLLEPEDLHAMAAEVAERTYRTARGRVVAVLEGGYVPPRVGLAAADVLRAFAGLPPAARVHPAEGPRAG